MPELITISVPTYRRPSLLLHTLHSCFIQDYRPLEIDVGDDSPGEESHTLVNSLSVPEGITVRYWSNRPSLGQAGNVNRLFANARGRRLVLLHDDDLLLPGALTAMDVAWQRADGVVAVYGMQQILLESGEIDRADTKFNGLYFKRDADHAGTQNDCLISAFWRQFPSDGYLVETCAARETGCRSFDEVGHACDTDFGIRLAINSRGRSFFLIDQVTSQYRVQGHSLSRSIDVTWRLYDYLLRLDGLDSEQYQARDSLLREIAAQATKENALHGRRRSALNIFLSSHYPRSHSLLKSLFHLSLIVMPGVGKLRGLPQPWLFSRTNVSSSQVTGSP